MDTHEVRKLRVCNTDGILFGALVTAYFNSGSPPAPALHYPVV